MRLDFSEKIIFGAFGSFIAFLLFEKLFGVVTAIWSFRILVAGGTIGVAVYVVQSGRLRLRARRAQIRGMEVDAETRIVKSHQGILMYEAGTGGKSFFHRSGRLRPKPVAPDLAETLPEPTEPAPLQPVIPAIRNSLSLVILGPQGTGKTTLLCHLIDARADGEPVIIDPHGYPGKYGNREIIGAGRDYGAIDQAFEALIREMNRRYQDYYRTEYHRLWIYIDETTLLNKNCQHFQRFMEVALTEFRKANMRLTLCLHSRRAKFLGLAGGYDLAEGIEWLTLKNDQGKRWAVLENETGDTDMALPGPYHPAGCRVRSQSQTVRSAPDNAGYGYESPDKGFDPDPLTLPAGRYEPDYVWEPETSQRVYESRIEKDVVDLYETGASLNQIGKNVYGYNNGKITAKIKAILIKHNLLKS